MNIHLKTKPGIEPQRFAILIQPEFVPTPNVHPTENDAELVRVIQEAGAAEIFEFEPDNPFRLRSLPTFLTPEQFAAEWMGD